MEEFVFEGMTPELRSYLDCDRDKFETTKAYCEERDRLHKAVPSGLLARYCDEHKVWLCRDETARCTEEHASPSGRYRIVATGHATKPGSWNYTRGRVYEGDRLIEMVYRNYSAFPFLFVEGHPSGHDYLVCGEDYQGQTVIELDTGKRVDYLPPEAAKGFGFCWADYFADDTKTRLYVDGCYWAAPYERLTVDFRNPMSPPFEVLDRGDVPDNEDESEEGDE